MTQIPLFGSPDDIPPPAPKRLPRTGTWTRWRGLRRLCDACTQLIHERGVDRAPVPRPARFRLGTEDGPLFYCGPHADQIRDCK